MIFCGKADINDQREIFKEFIDLVEKGIIPIERINESVEKILKLKEKYCSNEDTKKGENELKNDAKKKLELAKKLSLNSITLVQNQNNLVPVKACECLVLFPIIKLATLVDNETNDYTTLGNFLKSNEILYDENLENIDEIKEQSKDYKKIIFCTYNVKEDDYQTKLYNQLQKEKVIVVSMRSPYDYLYLNNYGAHICIYEATSLAYESLSLCLLGVEKFKGKLPIKK